MSDFTAYILKELQENLSNLLIAFTASFTGFAVAYLRSKKENKGKADWLEASICGFFSMSAWALMNWANIPQLVSVGIASFIGYWGTKYISDKIKNIFERLMEKLL